MRLSFRGPSLESVLITIVSFLVGAFMIYSSTKELVPLLSSSIFTASLLFRLFIHLVILIVGALILFYSILCIVQS